MFILFFLVFFEARPEVSKDVQSRFPFQSFYKLKQFIKRISTAIGAIIQLLECSKTLINLSKIFDLK